MFDLSMLDQNQNNAVSYQEFFHALGYTDKDTIYLRTFSDKDKSALGRNKQVQLNNIDSILPSLHKENQEDRGVFFIVNGGGHGDKDVKDHKALFIDFDNFPFEEQIQRINDFPLPPSIIIKTRKSLHCYWILEQSTPDPRERVQWRVMQHRLINHFGSDPIIENHSRVMRLYGFDHMKEDPVLVKLLHFAPTLTYTIKEFHDILPPLSDQEYDNVLAKENIQTATTSATGIPAPIIENERIPDGQGHYALMSKIGELLNKMGDTCDDLTILAAAKTWFIQRYEGTIGNDFDRKYLKTIQTLRARRNKQDKDPAFWSYAVKAWEAENKRKFNKKNDSWYEVRVAGERAEDAGLTFDDSIREYPTPPNQADPAADQGQQEEPPRGKSCFSVHDAGSYLSNGQYNADIQYFQKYKDRKVGFPTLDKYLTLYPGLCALGGASSLGKTTLAVNIADKLLARGETVLYFSFEQLPIEIITKSLARMLRERNPFTPLTNIDIKNGATCDDLEQVKQEYSELAKNLQIITGNFHTRAADIKEYVERFINEHDGIRPIVIIDYLQLIAPPDGFKGGIREYTDENIKTLKDMQKENELFVLMLSSFNRSSNDVPVSYEAFKETSMVEYTCDYILGLQLSILDAENTEFYASTGSRGGEKVTTIDKRRKMINEAQQKFPKEVELVSLKNRNGRQFFKVFFEYSPQYDLFTEAGDGKEAALAGSGTEGAKSGRYRPAARRR